MSATFTKLATILVVELGVRRDFITPATRFSEISTDELDWFAVLVQIEIDLHVDVDEAEFDELRTVGELADLIDAKLTAKEAA